MNKRNSIHQTNQIDITHIPTIPDHVDKKAAIQVIEVQVNPPEWGKKGDQMTCIGEW